MCHPRGHHGHHHASGDCCCTCGCSPIGGVGVFIRRYISSKEELEKLNAYKDQLEKELEGVKERIQELKKK